RHRYTQSSTIPRTVNCECQYVQDVSSRNVPDDATKLWSESSQRPVSLCSTSATRSPFRNASYGSRSAIPRVYRYANRNPNQIASWRNKSRGPCGRMWTRADDEATATTVDSRLRDGLS